MFSDGSPRNLRSAVRVLFVATMLVSGALAGAQKLTYSTTWVGNSFGGALYRTIGGTTENKHVQLNISGMAVDRDGTIYTNTFWDEGGNEAGIYKNGDLLGHCEGVSHGWGRQGGYSVAIDASYVYLDVTQNGDDGGDNGVRMNRNGLPVYPPRGTQWYCVRRFFKATGKSAPFEHGYGEWGDMMILNRLAISGNSYPEASPHGLAVIDTKLIVSDPFQKSIYSTDLKEMTGVRTTLAALADTGKVVVGASNSLWVIIEGLNPHVVHLDDRGALIPERLVLDPKSIPSSICWNAATGQLLVSDIGPGQNIKAYSPLPKTAGLVTKLGVLRGVHSGADGRTGSQRLFDPAQISADAQGNIYVVNTVTGSAGISLECYSPAASKLWELQCLEFVNCVDCDPASDQDIYSTSRHYVVNYKTSRGPIGTLRGVTMDRFKYPEDPRLHGDFSGGCWLRWIHGIRYLFVTQQMGREIGVLRSNPMTNGETLVPYAYVSNGYKRPDATGWPKFQPGSSSKPTDWIWRDTNENGKIDSDEYCFPEPGAADRYQPGWGVYVDNLGNIWQCGHGHVRCLKVFLDARGRPAWDFTSKHCELMDPPALPDGAQWQHGANGDNDDMDRIDYKPDVDVMYISGFTSAYPDDSGAWGDVGRVVYRYDHWSDTAKRHIHPGYPIQLPWGEKGALATKSICVEGDYIFCVQLKDPETVSVYKADTAQFVGFMVPGQEVGGKSGWVDANSGIRAHRRSDGEYLIFVEEDLYEKALIYRWRP